MQSRLIVCKNDSKNLQLIYSFGHFPFKDTCVTFTNPNSGVVLSEVS